MLNTSVGPQVTRKVLHLQKISRIRFQLLFKQKGIYCSDWFLDEFHCEGCDYLSDQVAETVEFAKGTLHSLFGFVRNTPTKTFHNKEFLALHDLELCRSSDGLHLRLESLDQLKGETENVGMIPLPAPDGEYSIMCLMRDPDSGRFEVRDSIGESMYAPDTVWIFRRKKP